MLEYFAYKKVKQHRAEKAASTSQPNSGRDSGRNSGEKEERGSRTPKPVLTPEDEAFLRRLAEEGAPPQLPERPIVFSNEVETSTGNDAQLTHTRDFGEEPAHHHSHPHSLSHESHGSKDKGKKKAEESGVHRTPSKSGGKFTNKVAALFGKSTKVTKEGLHADHQVSPTEAAKEEDDIAKVLNNLNMSAVNNRAFSLSRESQELVQKFTLVLKDIVNGAPHAYDDLVNLLENGQGTLAKSYESMPGFMQKLVTTLPEKLTSQLAPELLAVATEAQGLNKGGSSGVGTASAGGGLAGAAKSLLKPSSLKDLVTKPGAVAGMLKAIMNTLKLRWPAFMGTNVLLSLGLFGKSSIIHFDIEAYTNKIQSSCSCSGTATSVAAKSVSAKMERWRLSIVTVVSSSLTTTQCLQIVHLEKDATGTIDSVSATAAKPRPHRTDAMNTEIVADPMAPVALIAAGGAIEVPMREEMREMATERTDMEAMAAEVQVTGQRRSEMVVWRLAGMRICRSREMIPKRDSTAWCRTSEI